MGGILGVIRILRFFPSNLNAAYGIGILMIVLNFGYNISVGPLCKSMMAMLMQATRSSQNSLLLVFGRSRSSLRESPIFYPVSCASSLPHACSARRTGTGARAVACSGSVLTSSRLCTATFVFLKAREGRMASWIFSS